DRLLVGRRALLGPIAQRGALVGRRPDGIDRGREDDRHQGGCKQLSPTSPGTHACSLHLEPVSAGARAGSSRKKTRPTPWRYGSAAKRRKRGRTAACGDRSGASPTGTGSWTRTSLITKPYRIVLFWSRLPPYGNARESF